MRKSKIVSGLKIAKNGYPTRIQRIKYAIQGGLSDELLTDLGFDVDNLNEEDISIKKTIDSLSKYTYINDDTFNIDNEEVEKMIAVVFEILKNFVEIINSCRKDLVVFLDR